MNFRSLVPLFLAAFALWMAPQCLAGHKVLYLGDSLSFGAFGSTLDKKLRTSDCDVYTMITGGATPYYWLSDFSSVSGDAGHWIKYKGYERKLRRTKSVPKVETIFKKFRPDTAIIQTGTNLYASLRDKKRTPAERVKTVEYLVNRMCKVLEAGKCRIYWVTPPDSHVEKYPRELQEQMREIIMRVAGQHGRVFNSYAVTEYTESYPKEDGIHYGPEQATDWAKKVASDFLSWIATQNEGTATVAAADAVVESPPAMPPSEETVRKAVPLINEVNTIKVEAILKEKTPFLNPKNCTYRNAIANYEYKVLKVLQGDYPDPLLRVAHVVMRNSQLQPELDWKTGRREVLTLVPLPSYPDTEKLEALDELPESNLPVMTPFQKKK